MESASDLALHHMGFALRTISGSIDACMHDATDWEVGFTAPLQTADTLRDHELRQSATGGFEACGEGLNTE